MYYLETSVKTKEIIEYVCYKMIENKNDKSGFLKQYSNIQ